MLYEYYLSCMTANPSALYLNLIVADDHPIFTTGLKTVLAQAGSRYRFVIGGIARTGLQLTELLRISKADVLMCEIFLPDSDGSKLIASLRRANPDLKILVVTAQEDSRLVKAAFRSGADGYLLKTATETELLTALEAVVEGKTYVGQGIELVDRTRGSGVGDNASEHRFARHYGLTRREMEVMRHIGQALNNKEISERLFISDQTVSVHRKNIMRKLSVNNTASLIKIAYENNLVGD